MIVEPASRVIERSGPHLKPTHTDIAYCPPQPPTTVGHLLDLYLPRLPAAERRARRC